MALIAVLELRVEALRAGEVKGGLRKGIRHVEHEGQNTKLSRTSSSVLYLDKRVLIIEDIEMVVPQA